MTRTYTITITGTPEWEPVGSSGIKSEERQIADAIREALQEAVERFYQTPLTGVTVKVEWK
jgi:hypothetical protein